jgi:hypothetical protein
MAGESPAGGKEAKEIERVKAGRFHGFPGMTTVRLALTKPQLLWPDVA